MKSVHFKKSPKLPVSRALVAFLLVIVLAACGTNAGTTSSSAQPHPSSTAKKATNTSPSLDLNTVNVNVTMGNLVIQSTNGFQCPYEGINIHADLELGHLVLASDRAAYSQAEIAQMNTYLTYYLGNDGVANGKVLSNGIEPPSTLRWVLGGQTAPVPGTATPLDYPDQNCEANLTLTNIGSTPIQLSKVGVQLQASPQQNTYQYRLIDVCSFTASLCVYLGSGGGGSCSVYGASIQLGQGQQNDVFSAVPTAATGCGEATIAPGAQIQVNLGFSPATNIPQNLIYSIVPVFTVDTTQGNQTISVPQLGKTLAFAGVSQFSCYGLQGTTFALEKSPAFSLYARGTDGGPNPPPGKEHWCL
jgi:archaellin